MARKKDFENNNIEEKRTYKKKGSLKDETMQSIIAIIFFVISAILLLGSLGKAGKFGSGSYEMLGGLFGVGYFLLPIMFILLGASFLKTLEKRFSVTKIIFGLVFFVSGLGIIEIVKSNSGGTVGSIIVKPLISAFDVYSSIIILFGTLIASILVLFDTHIKSEWIKIFRTKKEELRDDSKEIVIKGSNLDDEEDTKKESLKKLERVDVEEKDISPKIKKNKKEDEEDLFSPKGMSAGALLSEYTPPPISLLEEDRGKPGVGDIKANANIIKRTLLNFGIDVEMDEVTIGPTVTRYSMKPAEGVKLSKIVNLQDNLALALAAQSIRIEAPIPGKSLVGIEVPNSSKTVVGLGSMINSKEFQSSPKPLLVSVGKDVSGDPVFADLAKMPHLLVAGTTGSGKSVTVHAILNSLLYRNSPQMLKFIMVDAKRVELTLYNKIPHLLTPVITEAKKTILALKWAAKEMDRRYDVLEKESVRDINSYHKNILEPALSKKNSSDIPETMPYIVIVIDELADLMQAYPRELESAIVRLAQMSRAVGIHLVLSTQRPSVNVITGLIKANIPTRIALKVGSQIDSRTIIDKAGAEKLVGQGDMLFSTQDAPEPRRIQSPYITESEVKKVVKFIVDHTPVDSIPEDISSDNNQPEERNPIFDQSVMDSGSSDDDDDLYEEAKNIVVQAGKASTSYIQRKLRVGYARAARLMDLLEDRGIIGPQDGAKPREVLTGGASTENEEMI